MAKKMVDVWSAFLNRYLPMILTFCAIATFGSTERHVGWLGQDVRLPCNITNEDVLALYWMNDSDITKASYFKQQRISLDDRFTLNEDLSLVISDLEVSDEGRYVCHVEFYSGESLKMPTILAVYALVSTPRIEQCAREPTGNEFQSFCEMKTSKTQPFNLECRVAGFRPNVTLEWTSSGTRKQPLGEPFQKTLPDGTADREVTISATAKVDEDRSYTCRVKGRATNGTERTATITVLALSQGVSTWAKITIGVLVGGFVLIIFTVVGVVLHRRGNLKVLRKEIKTYTFKKPSNERDAAAHICVFGEMGAGKSTFINSIEFAYKAKQTQTTGDRGTTSGGDTPIRVLFPLTDSIFLFDNRGMKDFSLSYVDEYMKEIGDDEEEASTSARLLSEEIHCAVFVYRHGDSIKMEAALKFLDEFAKQLRNYSGYPPMVVITHANSLSTEDKRDITESFKTCRNNVWFFENYTDPIENLKKSVQFLKFLKSALYRCEVAIVNIERRKKQRKNKKGVIKEEKGFWRWLLGW